MTQSTGRDPHQPAEPDGQQLSLFEAPAASSPADPQPDLPPLPVVDPSAAWPSGPIAAFDLETTGKDPAECRIVTASLVELGQDGAVLREQEWLVDPGVEIPEGAQAVHGISTEHARSHGVPAAQAVPEIVRAVQRLQSAEVPITAFNAAYDITVLTAEARRHGLEIRPVEPVLDPYVMHKHVRVRWRGKRTLTALTEAYGVALEAAHTSAADALAAGQLARLLAEQHPELAVPARQLHQAQIGWAQEQAADFQEFLRRKRADPSVEIDGRWPLRV